MAARVPVRLFSGNTAGLRAALYSVPNVTTSDTADVGSTGLNDFNKVFLAVQVGLDNAALAPTTLSNATNLVLSQATQTGETSLLLVIGAST